MGSELDIEKQTMHEKVKAIYKDMCPANQDPTKFGFIIVGYLQGTDTWTSYTPIEHSRKLLTELENARRSKNHIRGDAGPATVYHAGIDWAHSNQQHNTVSKLDKGNV